jgi:PEP-CTERM motif
MLDLRIVCLCAAIFSGAIVVGSASTASATPASFAQFSEASPGGNLFALNTTTPETDFGTSTGGPLGAAIPVNFTYLTLSGLPVDLQGVQQATLSMTSSTVSPVITGFGGTVATQSFTGAGTLPNSISIIRDTPAAEGLGAMDNLLTITFTNSTLIGILGNSAPQMTADTATAGVVVTYSSDFLTFANGEKNFSLTFSSWNTPGDGNGLATNGNLQALLFQAATAAGAGTFGGSASVFIPEPSTMVLAGIGVVGLALAARRRRK